MTNSSDGCHGNPMGISLTAAEIAEPAGTATEIR